MTAHLTLGEYRQLDLLKGPRQRGTRPKAALERNIHIAVADTLLNSIKPGWRYTHIASGEFRSKATAGLLQRMGVRGGFPDFLVVGPGGICGLEIKRKGAKATVLQAEVGACFRAGGGKWAVADSYDAAVAILKRWGVLA